MDLLTAAVAKLGAMLVYPAAFLFVLTVVVFVHEFGHFWVGRLCGVGVKAFSIGFGRELFGWYDRHGTRWKLSAIPLGGYVKFVGDMNGASVPDEQSIAAMTSAERAVSFHHQVLWKRAAIVAAGPVANFIMAIAVFSTLTYVSGKQVLLPRIEAVSPDTPAERAGFKAGDVITSIDGTAIAAFSDVQRIVSSRAGEPLTFEVERGDRTMTLSATPEVREVEMPGFGKARMGLIGLRGSRDPADIRLVRYGIAGSLANGVSETWSIVDRTMDYLGKLVSGRESPQQLSGPIGIMRVSGNVATLGGASSLVGLIAILSVSIGLLNLFPIPLLDGGHLLFYAVEAVRGRPLSDRAQEIGFRIGLALVVTLMLFATWNDILNLVTGFTSRGS